MLRVLDLFSGIGGFSLGLERTQGFETVAFCEIDPFCRRVLAKHWPDVPCHDDVTTRYFQRGEADVICGGFPCQDISYAGAGAGLAGSRSGLYRELVRAIRLVRPLYAVLENVAALLGRGLGTVLGDMAAVGYDAEWHCIPASAVGAHHRRDRVWIIAHTRSEQHEGDSAPLSGPLASQLSRANTATYGEWKSQSEGAQPEVRRRIGNVGQDVADANGAGLEGWREHRECAEERSARPGGRSVPGDWLPEPDVGRVAHGVPSRVDRLRSLGNAVVPQIPEIIGRAILASLAQREAA